MFLLIKTGSTMRDFCRHYGDFEDWMIRYMGVMRQQVKIVDAQRENLPSPKGFDGVLLTGAHEMVTDLHEWSELTAKWLRGVVENEIPVMGVCYGHQLLAHAMGGIVGDHPNGPEIGTVSICPTENAKNDPLFKSVNKPFTAHVTHTQSVLKLPQEAELLASNDYELHHAFRIGKNAWGVQFHPEYDSLICREYALFQKHKLINPEQTLCTISETPVANTFLERFTRYCSE